MLSWGSVEEEIPRFIGEIDNVDVDEIDFEEEPKVSRKKKKKAEVKVEKSIRRPNSRIDLPDLSVVKVPRAPTVRTPRVPTVPQTPKATTFTLKETAIIPRVTMPPPFAKKVEIPLRDDHENFKKIPQKSITGVV